MKIQESRSGLDAGPGGDSIAPARQSTGTSMETTTPGSLLLMFAEHLPDYAITLFDPDGRVTTWNAGAQAILGYSADEAIGLHLSCFYTPADNAGGVPAANVAEALKQGRKAATRLCVRKDGTEVMAHSVLMPMYDRQNKLLGFGSLTHGMTGMVGVAADPAPPQEENEQILVVDDNEEVRVVAVRLLTSLGYRVIAVSDGAQALEALASGVQIDLLFTDVVMPGGLNGREVAEEARKLRSRLKVLFTSGYFEGALVRQGEIEEDVEFIMKPYRRKDLAEKVRALLAERGSSAPSRN
jgi:PAS domain S-box-containing protein